MKIEETHINNLIPKAQEFLAKNDIERIIFIQEEKWVTYPSAKNVLDKLELLLHHPPKSRMPGLLIVGETNNGKTSIIKRFAKLNKDFKDPEKFEATQKPVILVQAPPSPDLSYLFTNILEQFAAPFKNSDKTQKKEMMIKNYISVAGTRIIIIDEIHNILSGATAKQKQFMNGLKNLSNDLNICIILSGIKDALHATNTDPQINNRFKPIFLSKWKLDRDFLSFLASLEKVIPLKKASNLHKTKELAYKIFDLSEGYIGEMVDLINTASIYSIQTKSEKITLKEIKECGFIKPSMRKSFDDLVDL